MRLRRVKNAFETITESKYYIEPKYKGCAKKIFNNDNPICLEIGMGKGDFVIGMAKLHPEINFIGIEQADSVLVRAIQKLESEKEFIPNLRVMLFNAFDIDEAFSNEIDTIYLNFSDPWPKNRHHKRRLTSLTILDKYDKVFKNDSHIVMKTDNKVLFGDSIVTLSEHGYKFSEVYLDLHSVVKENVETEYEKKFVSKGVTINYLDAKFTKE